MKTFLLLMHIFLGGQHQVYILDYGLSVEDCLAAIEENGDNPALECRLGDRG